MRFIACELYLKNMGRKGIKGQRWPWNLYQSRAQESDLIKEPAAALQERNGLSVRKAVLERSADSLPVDVFIVILIDVGPEMYFPLQGNQQ